MKGIKIVGIKWLWSCLQRWEHVEESLFTLSKEEGKLQYTPPTPLLVSDNTPLIYPSDTTEIPLLFSRRPPQIVEPEPIIIELPALPVYPFQWHPTYVSMFPSRFIL